MASISDILETDGWTDLGAASSIRLLQVDPRVSTTETGALEVIRRDAAPAASDAGLVLYSGDIIASADFSALGDGSNLYARAVRDSARIVLEASA